MLFNSYIFIFIFLPLTLLGYFSLNKINSKTSKFFLLAMSLWFYGYFNISYLLIIISSILVNYLLTYFIIRTERKKFKKVLFYLDIFFNLGLIFYYKYYNFFLKNISVLSGYSFELKNILLPLGISFFTFQQISFCIDVYHGEVSGYSFLDYAVYVSYFPQLIAGPIVTHDELIPQFNDEKKRAINYDNIAKGLFLFILGLSKKVLLADVFGKAANYGYSNIYSLSSVDALITILSYTFEIYFDFSGYSDMALGIAKMMNIDLPVNFNSPYAAINISDFWKRWHITLTRFFTKYVYFPLGGNRKGAIRTYLNILIVFFLSGLWHGSNWNFIFWGLLHGFALVIYRKFRKSFDDLNPVLGWIILFGFVNFSWIFFRADTIKNGLQLIHRVLLFNFNSVDINLIKPFQISEIFVFFSRIPFFGTRYANDFVYAFFVIALFIVLQKNNSYMLMGKGQYSVLKLVVCLMLTMLCVTSFSSLSIFLYFNF